MKGQIILMGYAENPEDKLLIVEAEHIEDEAGGGNKYSEIPTIKSYHRLPAPS